MSGQVLSASTGVLGIALLPHTGSTRPLFYAAAVMLVGSVIAFSASFIARKNQAKA